VILCFVLMTNDLLRYPMIPVMVMWNGNNIGGTVKRGVGIAMQIGVGNCGGVIASFMYVPSYFLLHRD
jgi:hypothetical protein